ncbi:hypothetical protein F2Q69_00041924 [Brassica cretica]|uniref:Uncharacterized protein n=1 Tax=Brassica cretica TaxID=69181 RepID=A0A8S9NP28_BRACR|nr:hypothetical protein F2Q69_00041924 [Brassica cretica]
MVAPSFPPDVPSLLMAAPSSSTVVLSSSPVASNSLMAASSSSPVVPSSPMADPSSPPDVPSSSMAAPSSPPDVPSSSMAAPSSPPDVPSSSMAAPSSSMVALSSSPVAPHSLMAIPSSSPVAPNSSMVASSSISSVAASDPLSMKECGRDAEGTSLPLEGTSSAFVSSSSVPSLFLGSSLSLAVPSLPLSMEPCRGESELNSSIGMPLDGKVACEQLSLLVRKMELADGRKSWLEIAESVIVVELGTLTGSEAEDRVSASLIEEGTGFLFDEHGANLVAEPGVGGSKLSLKTLPVVSISSSLVKKTMLETVRKHDEESADGADSESDNAAGDDRRDDDVENVDVEDDGALGDADDKQNGTGDVNVGEESEQDKFASDGDYDAVGDDEMGDRDGFDERSDFSGVRVRENEDGLVERGEIRRCLEAVMEEKSVELRENGEAWKRLAVEAGRERGSSDKNMEAFVETLFSGAEEVKDKNQCLEKSTLLS